MTILRFILATIAFVPGFFFSRFNFDAILSGLEIGSWCSIGYIFQAIALKTTSGV